MVIRKSILNGVNINAATFAYFKAPDGNEMVGRSMLLDEDVVETRAVTGGVKRWRVATESEVRTEAVSGLWSTYFFNDDRLDRLIELLKQNATQN